MKSWHDECGVFGIWGDPEAAQMTYLGLYAQQHRGQEGAGIVSLENGCLNVVKGFGHVGEVFSEEKIKQLKGSCAIGHVRYSTSGDKKTRLSDVQPLSAEVFQGLFCLSHNGNIVNAKSLRKSLTNKGAIFQGSSDSEILLHLISHHPSSDIIESLKEVLKLVKGAYSFVILTKDNLIAIRDPLGMRPLVLGRRPLSSGGFSYVFASESCAFDLIGAELVREIEPGEMFYVGKKGEASVRFAKAEKSSQCIFEHVYFSRPDSFVFGAHVYESRKNMGRQLAKESFTEADMVVSVPDSGTPAALGYSEESKIPFEMGIIRNHYIGRTFIQPSQSIRSFGVKIKLNPQLSLLKGKKLVVIDDSLVRGTTCKKLVSLLRQFGAREIHLKISSPPIVSPCYYGVDTPDKEELIASFKTVEEIKNYLNVDSLYYLSLKGMKEAVKSKNRGFCSACFDEKYPHLKGREDIEKTNLF